jgi:uncharacterized repeat protein (TIGR01451 family)
MLKLGALSALVLSAALLIGTASAQEEQAENPIRIAIQAFIVSQVTAEDGTTEERLTESDTARPGQVVEYRVTATNQDPTTLPAGTVSVVGPIPEGARYVDGSATPSSQQVRTEFSADGQTFSEPPVLAGGAAVDPADYAAVRWTLLVPLEPQQEVRFVYRVVIE